MNRCLGCRLAGEVSRLIRSSPKHLDNSSIRGAFQLKDENQLKWGSIMKITRTISKVLFGGGGILLLGFTFVGQAAAQSLYVVDRVKAAVLKFDGATGAPLGIFTSGDVGDDPDPYSLACGPNGNLFVSFFRVVLFRVVL